jgi:hypothetical protein
MIKFAGFNRSFKCYADKAVASVKSRSTNNGNTARNCYAGKTGTPIRKKATLNAINVKPTAL